MKLQLPKIRTKAGQYSWLQVLALGISVVAYMAGSMTVAVVMLLIGTVFGVIATYARVQQARALGGNVRVRRRR